MATYIDVCKTLCLTLCSALFASVLLAEDSWQPILRRLPPAGIELSAEPLAELRAQHASLSKRYNDYAKQADPQTQGNLLADVEVFLKAVDLALVHGEFYKPADVDVAQWALDQASDRFNQLAAGKPSWTKATGLVVRGYRSPIDGSVQPYGMEIPEGIDPARPVPLYVWLHGRGDKNTDLYFLKERAGRPGPLKLKDAIVLHPFGRHCIGFKSAGEIDVLHAIRSAARNHSFDYSRIVLAGFSMGGAGAWHIGAHYTERFAAVHAGAGFAETKFYTRLAPDTFPPKYEQLLWQVYDVPYYARNLLNVPVIAYSGEIDKQKQAADVMAAALAEQGSELKHVIGPGMGHKYHPDSLKEVQAFLAAAVEKGRDRRPKQVHLQTPTLRYNRMHWVELLAMDEHWREARIDVEVLAADHFSVTTSNARAVGLAAPDEKQGAFAAGTRIDIDGQILTVERPAKSVRLVREQQWRLADGDESVPRVGSKRPGLQGPIDDAFLAPFLVVTPTGEFGSPEKKRWVEFELAHFLARWRAVYRGEARVKRDDQITDDDLQQYHLVLFGDRVSNRWIQKLADRLPIVWNDKQIEAGQQNFDSANHLPLLICPNPANPERYVVLNSGPTHREAHDRTNSLQNPKLPDWAIVDVRVAPTDSRPGKVVAADFFDEQWQVKQP